MTSCHSPMCPALNLVPSENPGFVYFFFFLTLCCHFVYALYFVFVLMSLWLKYFLISFCFHTFNFWQKLDTYIDSKVIGPELAWIRSMCPLWLLGSGKYPSSYPHSLHDASDSMVQSSRASLSSSSPELSSPNPNQTSNSGSYASPASGLFTGGSCTGAALDPKNNFSDKVSLDEAKWQGGLCRNMISILFQSDQSKLVYFLCSLKWDRFDWTQI